jgi:PST family polysaccharide transporter/antigen flippase
MPQQRGFKTATWFHHLPFNALATASAHGLRMIASLVVLKMVSVEVGPQGLGAIGNLISFLSVVMVFAGGGIANGIIKYSAQYQTRPRSTIRLIESALALGLSVSGVVMLTCVVWAPQIAAALFSSQELWWLSPIVGFTHFFAFVGAFTIALANGHHRADLFAGISIVAYLASIASAWIFITLLGFAGAPMALMFLAGSTGIPASWLLLRTPVRRLICIRFHRHETLGLLRFSAMTLVSALSFPVVEVILRSSIAETLDLTQAGLWQASIRLSGAVLGFYTVYLATIFMPRVSVQSDSAATTQMVTVALVRVGGTFAAVALVLFLFRDLVITLLFSSDFLKLADVLGWQLLGDTLRTCSYVIGFVVIARARMSLHIGAELVQYTLFLASGLIALYVDPSLESFMKGYAISYAVYLAIGLIWFYRWGRHLT